MDPSYAVHRKNSHIRVTGNTWSADRRHNSLGPFGLTTIGSDGDGADLSPAARSGGMRRRPRAQAALLEHDDLFENGLRIMHHSGLGDPLGVVHKVRLGADAR